jgi:ATP-dependent protease ClpP protease subunit
LYGRRKAVPRIIYYLRFWITYGCSPANRLLSSGQVRQKILVLKKERDQANRAITDLASEIAKGKIKKTLDAVEKIVLARSRRTLKKVAVKANRRLYLATQVAIRLGFCDEVKQCF